MRIIMGIQIGDREQEAVKVQELLTKYGCTIKTRLGLHESAENLCSSRGLILIEFIQGKEEEVQALENELSTLSSVIVRQMTF